jgi:RHS repeat-associated protein
MSAPVPLDYMLARYYSSSLGRFMAVDPGDDTALEDPQSWNRFAYVRNNPLRYSDPQGTNPMPRPLGVHPSRWNPCGNKPVCQETGGDGGAGGANQGEGTVDGEGVGDSTGVDENGELWASLVYMAPNQASPGANSQSAGSSSRSVSGSFLGDMEWHRHRNCLLDIECRDRDAVLANIEIAEAGFPNLRQIGAQLLKGVKLDGPSGGGRIFQFRYRSVPIIRIDLHPYPGTNGVPRLHMHLPWLAPRMHIPLDPRRWFD